MINFNSINAIQTVWTDDGSSYLYKAVSGSISGNGDSKSIRFKLREVNGQDRDFQVVIQQMNDGSHVFKTDYYEDPEREYSLRECVGDGELLFYFNGKEGIAYFHLSVKSRSRTLLSWSQSGKSANQT